MAADIRKEKKTIVITGFGLFRGHNLNPSWEAIKNDKIKINRSDLIIITKQIDVSYQDVDKTVSELWTYYKPILMVHVGLSALESCIRIEERARHGPYIHDDVKQCAPHKHLRQYNSDEEQCSEEGVVKHKYGCKPCQFSCSKTNLNVDKICDKMNELYEKKKLNLKTKKSLDAGLYVCEYIYQYSLNMFNQLEHDGHCIFIHVPDTKIFKLEDITASIQEIINIIVDLYIPK